MGLSLTFLYKLPLGPYSWLSSALEEARCAQATIIDPIKIAKADEMIKQMPLKEEFPLQ
jgi:hypothetical protein